MKKPFKQNVLINALNTVSIKIRLLTSEPASESLVSERSEEMISNSTEKQKSKLESKSKPESKSKSKSKPESKSFKESEQLEK